MIFHFASRHLPYCYDDDFVIKLPDVTKCFNRFASWYLKTVSSVRFSSFVFSLKLFIISRQCQRRDKQCSYFGFSKKRHL